jgi:PKD repeat protein
MIATPIAGAIPLQVEFNVILTNGAAPYTYAWDFGDGGTSIEENPTHLFTTAGTYWVVLTVTDASSLTASSTALIDARSVILKIVELVAGDTMSPAESVGFQAGGALDVAESMSPEESVGFISGGAVNQDDPISANLSESIGFTAGGAENANDDFSLSESLVITNS